MQPFVFDRRHYESSLFKSIKMIDAHLQLEGFLMDLREFYRALKDWETPSLEEVATVSTNLYATMKDPAWRRAFIKNCEEDERLGRVPSFILQSKNRNYTIQLKRIAPSGARWKSHQPERL